MIRDLKSGENLTAQQLAERLAKAARVLVGQQHDNPDHQALELWILQVLADRRVQGSVLLEMISPDQQPRVDEVKESFKSIAPVDIPTALAWQGSWDWVLYGPVVRYALGQPYPLLSASLGRDEGDTILQTSVKCIAQQLLAAPLPALLFAGAQCVCKEVGVPLQLVELGAGDEAVVLLLAEVGAHVTYSSADYVWYTAASPKYPPRSIVRSAATLK